MRALLDVSCLLALMDKDHIHHARARKWWRENDEHGWASCPLTQNGFVRISSQQSYPGYRPARDAFQQLQLQVAKPDHAFWPDDISITDPEIFDHSWILGPNKIGDVYLLALAVKNGGRLATFDRAIPMGAVRGAEPHRLVVL